MRAAETKAAQALGLGRVGLWSISARFSPRAVAGAQEVEALGYKTMWIPGGVDSGVLANLEQLLAATKTLNFATGIINIWKHEPAELAAWWHKLPPAYQARLFLGLGVSHGPLIGEAWAKPIVKTREFLDGLDAAGMPRDRLCLAALGPRMLELAAARTAGAHPYNVTARHTAFARKKLGPDAVLAPEQGVVLETDREKAREIARGFLKHYGELPNYAKNWRRDGFSDAEIAGLSDRLVDDLIVWGDVGAIKARVEEHLANGADHVCMQVIGAGGMVANMDDDLVAWRKLAALL